MLDSLLIKQSFGKCLSATPTKRLQKMQWLDDHKNHVHQLTYTHFDTIIIDDLITAGLSPYSNAWETFFKELLNLGIVGDCTQHILFQVERLPVPSHLKYVIHCGTNNVSKDNLSEIVKCILCIALLFKKRNPSLKIIINRIFSEGYGTFSHFHIIVPQINQLLEFSTYSFIDFLEPTKDWLKCNGDLNNKLFWTDHLHLSRFGNQKF